MVRYICQWTSLQGYCIAFNIQKLKTFKYLYFESMKYLKELILLIFILLAIIMIVYELSYLNQCKFKIVEILLHL